MVKGLFTMLGDPILLQQMGVEGLAMNIPMFKPARANFNCEVSCRTDDQRIYKKVM